MPLSPGTRLGPYEIVAALGSGGMGEVYRRARHAARPRRRGQGAAAAPDGELRGARRAFEREARAVSSLNHPHICTLHDVGREGDTDYLVMELVEGETLAQRLAQGALPVADVLRLGIEIADALGAARTAPG
jgi:serine/threonine protein kinase